ncbi:transcriptional regulator [Archaeoglobales archaeon]|nr:MAG: transcriptional regulator [Archaeoglobales archaeon]
MMITQVVFVGLHKEKLIESIRALREEPVGKIILMVGEQELPAEAKVRELAEELKKELETVYDVEISKIDKKNTLRAAKQLVELIREETEKGNEVLLNASGSLRNVSIAAYIAACITNSRIITSIPKYDDKENEVGIEEILEIPLIPVMLLPKEQIQIIQAIDGGVDSLDELIQRLNPGIGKSDAKFMKERSRISHHLSKLEDMGFVKRKKVGRNVRIERTAIAEIINAII